MIEVILWSIMALVSLGVGFTLLQYNPTNPVDRWLKPVLPWLGVALIVFAFVAVFIACYRYEVNIRKDALIESHE